MAKLLTVFGATGAQGGALLNYVLRHPTLSTMYKLRGITRDVSKDSAVALANKGVEMVKGDMNDIESLKEAVAGSYAVFSMTNYWERVDAEIEVTQGKAIADASVAAGTTLIIWSSLPNVTEMTGGKLTGMKHFDSKAKVEAYIRTLPIKSVFYMPAMFMQTFRDNFKPRRTSEGIIECKITWDTDTATPMIDIDDTGAYLAPILLSPPEIYHGKNLTCATAFYTPTEVVAGWKEVTGHDVKIVHVDAGARMLSASIPDMSPEMQKVLREASGLLKEYGYYGPTGRKDLQWTLDQMEDKPTTWKEFVRKNEPWFQDD